MISKANKKLWILRRLKYIGADPLDLLEVYEKQIRCILELAAPAWQGSITQAERVALERVQKSACYIILGEDFISYSKALKTLNLDTLESRRRKLSLKFAIKASKHPKFKSWFKLKEQKINSRHENNKYWEVRANHVRFEKSPISYLTKLLNEFHKNKKK